MPFYIIISILFTLEYEYNTDLLTFQYTGNNSDCLTDELYGDFTIEEYNNLIERRKLVRTKMQNKLYRYETDTLFIPLVFHNLYKTVEGTAINSYCDFGYDILINDQDRCNERMMRTIEILNAQYMASGVQFKLHDDFPEMLPATDSGYDGFYEDATGGNSTSPNANTIKNHYNIPNALNIYTHECLPSSDLPCIDGKFGFSTYPWNLDNNEPGIFIKHQSLPGSEDTYFGATASQVGILAHEISHFFSLQHINGTWFLMDTNTPRELVSGQDCESYGDLICDTPGSPGYIVINNTLASYYTNSVSRECIYHGYGGNYNLETGILQIGGYNKSYFQGYYPNYNFCEEWGFEDPYGLDENCVLFTNYDNQGHFFGTRDLPAACINEDESEYAANCHIDQYSYLPIGNNFMQAGTATLHYCSPRPIGHANYDDTNHGFTEEQFANIRYSTETDYLGCIDLSSINYNKNALIDRGDCLYKKNKAYNYPNPIAEGKTTFRFYVNNTETSEVQVKIYNAAGYLVEDDLLQEYKTSDKYFEIKWDNIDVDAGLYFAEISPDVGQSELVRMVVIK